MNPSERSQQTGTHPEPAFRDALNRCRPTMEDIAEAIDVPVATLRAYHAGTRAAPTVIQQRLERFLRRQCTELLRAADMLAREAGR